MCEIGWQMTNSAHSDRVAATATTKQKGIYRAKEGKNRPRQRTMQAFIKTCCAFKLGAVFPSAVKFCSEPFGFQHDPD